MNCSKCNFITKECICDCIITLEQCEANLLAIEAKLAKRWNLEINSDLREKLKEIIKSDETEEDDLVSDWLFAYAIYSDGLHWEQRNCLL